MSKDYNVFLCYRGEGSMLAASIYSELFSYTKNKLKLFYAPKCIKQGENFMTTCKEVAGKVSLMILVLTPNFFSQCYKNDDVTLQELRAALANPTCSFLPIITPGFEFEDDALGSLFSETEIDRIKHISAIKYTDVYSFNSIELLLPILKDRVGVTDYDEIIESELRTRRERAKGRIHINDDSKAAFFSQDNKVEAKRLETQQKLLLEFDMPVYEKHLQGKSGLSVLDIGCGNGRALMARLGNRPEVDKIIGIEFNESFVERARADYESERVKFYQVDLEAPEFADEISRIMEENGIERFDFINVLAVVSHLKSPHHVMKALRKVAARGCTVFIRNVDDGLNFAYPDENMHFERAFNMLAKCDTTGYRYSGRELFTILQRAGYRDIVYEKMGICSASMDYSEKEAFFDTIFIFLKNSMRVTALNNPHDNEIQTENEWLLEHFDELEEKFLAPDFLANLGFVIVTATI